MSRIPIPATATAAPAASQPVLAQIQKAFGASPAMFRAVSNSPAALQALWGFFGALGGGTLPAKLAEQIAVAVADRNRCATCHVVEFCTACHAQRPRSHGLLSTFSEEHARLARINPRPCLTCHGQAFCADCHRIGGMRR